MSDESGTNERSRRCIEQLVAHGDELEVALQGRSLRVLVDYVGGPTLRIVFTRSGYVAVVPDDEPFEPHVEVRGSGDEVAAFALELTSLADAVTAGTLTIRVPEEEVAAYRTVRGVVADILEQMPDR